MSTLLSSSDVSAGFWNDAAEHRIAPKRTRALSAFWGKTWGRSPEEIFRLQAVPRTGPEEHRLPNVPENVVILDVPSFVRSSVEAMLVRGEHLKVVQDIVRLCWDEADVLLRPVPVKTEEDSQFTDDDITPTPTSVDEIVQASPFRKENGHPVREVKSKVRGLAVVGHPGIGKTLWLYLILVLRLSAELPTVFQVKPDTFMYFDEGGVGTFSLREIAFELRDSLPATIWWLADSNPDMMDVPKAAVLSHRFVLQAATYRTDHAGWMRAMPPLMYTTRAWTVQELLVGCAFRSVSLDDEVDFARLVETVLPTPPIVYSHVGGTYAALQMETDLAVRGDFMQRIISAAADGSSLFTDEKLFAMCHQIFLVSPVLDRLKPPTLTSSPRILVLLQQRAAETWSRTYPSIPLIPSTPCYRRASWLGTLAVVISLTLPGLIQTLQGPQVYQLQKGPRSAGHLVWSTVATTSQTPVPKVYLDLSGYGPLCFQNFKLTIHEYFSAPQLPLDGIVLYKPISVDGILPGFDAFLVDATSKSAIVFRVTVASSRKVTSGDIERFKKWGITSIHFIALVEGPGPHTVYLPEDDSFIATKAYCPISIR